MEEDFDIRQQQSTPSEREFENALRPLRFGDFCEMRKIWEDKGLFLFYLPPYSPELNPAETLWRILKDKWIRPADYNTKDSLFYCTNRALVSVGTNLFVNYSYV